MSRNILWSVALCLWCVHSGSTDNLQKICKSSDCLQKCCPEDHIYHLSIISNDEDHSEIRKCVNNRDLINDYGVMNPDNYSYIGVYNKDIQRITIKMNKTINNFRFVHDGNFANHSECSSSEYFEEYLLEDGKLALRSRNYLRQWRVHEPGQFCIDHEVSEYNTTTLESTTPYIVLCFATSLDSAPTTERAVSNSYGLIVSCVFLLLTVAVYVLLPEKRNLAELTLMALLSTYFALFFIRIIHVFGNENQTLDSNGCFTLTIIFYYLRLASYCWINVMSFDIWWTFRGIRKSALIHRRGVMSKFLRYGAYAWGLPILPTLFMVIVDQLDLAHIPDFVKPNLFDSCFFRPDSHLLYVRTPTMILNCVNMVLIIMTAFNHRQVKRGVGQYEDSANNQMEEHRLWVHMKLSLLIGVSWILDLNSNSVVAKSLPRLISDLYNALFGLFIFLLFVCKKKIFLRVCDRLSINNRLVDFVRQRTEDSHVVFHMKIANHSTDTSDVEHCAPTYKQISNQTDDI